MEHITREELRAALQFWTVDAKANPEDFSADFDESYGQSTADYLFGLIEDDKV